MNIDTAEKAELKAYARDELGLSLSMNMHEDTMRQKIRDQLDAMGLPEPNEPAPQAEKKTDGKVIINIQKSAEKGGGRPVPVGVQGKMYTIPRGKDIPVPPSVEFALRVAIQDKYEQDEDTGEMIKTEVPSYPYQVVGGFEYVIKDNKSAA